MVAGLVLLVVGALVIVAAVFTADGTDVELLGFDVTALGLYLVGVGSGLAILWGFGLTKWGTRRSLRHRRELRARRREGATDRPGPPEPPSRDGDGEPSPDRPDR